MAWHVARCAVGAFAILLVLSVSYMSCGIHDEDVPNICLSIYVNCHFCCAALADAHSK